MTVMFVFLAMIVANVVYAIRDSRKAESAQAMREFYRVEYKKSYASSEPTVMSSWY